MSDVVWEDGSDQETQTEIEAILENSGESDKIRTFLRNNGKISEWRAKIVEKCQKLVAEGGAANMTSDDIYSSIYKEASEAIPPDVYASVADRLTEYLSTKFEDSIDLKKDQKAAQTPSAAAN